MAKAIGDALAKFWTYQKISDQAKIASGTLSNPLITPALVLDTINSNVAEAASVLNGASAPFFSTTIKTLVITGSANPYSCSIVDLSPFIDKIAKVVHVTNAGVRTVVLPVRQDEADALVGLTSTHASGIWYVHDGDEIKFFKGASFTITTATDVVHLTYYRQPKMSTTVALTDYLDMPDKYCPLVKKMVVAELIRFKNDGRGDAALEQGIDKDLNEIYQSFGAEKSMGQK
jgi:hypothetical protein